jgi:hypothetical protein
VSTADKIARWLCDYDGSKWDNLTARQVILYGDLADELLRLIYAEGAQDAVAFDLDGDA